jgi:alcohol oxidase
MDLATTNMYALPGNLTANIQHGSWSMPLDKPDREPKASFLSSNQRSVFNELKYSKKDIEHIEEWVKRHVETTWHSLGVRNNPVILIRNQS